MKYGYITVAAAVPTVRVADTDYNATQTESLIAQAEGKGVEIVCFPELGLTGYTCQDLFHNQLLLDKAEQALVGILDFTRKLDVIAIIGMPIPANGLLLNCAVVVQQGQILGVVPKTYLPNYHEFYERRWFTSAGELHPTRIYLAGSAIDITATPKVFVTMSGVKFGVEICEDIWAPIPPSDNLALAGADIVFNLSSSDELLGKHDYLKSMLASHSSRLMCGYVYAGSGYGESTGDVVFGGKAFIYDGGELCAEGKRFAMDSQLCISQIDVEHLRTERRSNSTYTTAQHSAEAELRDTRPTSPRDFALLRAINPLPFIPPRDQMEAVCEEALSIQTMGLVKRLQHTRATRVVVGVSGGLDSTLALLVAARAFDILALPRHGIIAVTMPGFGTSSRTHTNAQDLMERLGTDSREISIARSVSLHFEDIGHDAAVHDTTYENSQARERTQILMDLANREGALVVGTGDLSELALGWATYNGDHMSMYGVNAGVPKTLIRYIVRYEAQRLGGELGRTLLDIIDTPISPELTPADSQGNIAQKTEDLVGPYELHDFFIWHFLSHGFSPAKIYMLAQKAFDGSDPSGLFFDAETIHKWLRTFCRRFFAQQFKRSCLPDGPKVCNVSLSPRGDWRMPSDADSAIWMKEME